MTKADLIRTIAAHAEITAAQAQLALEALEDSAITTLKKEGEFALPGFGKLKVKKTAARMGRNPSTGEAIKIKAGKRVTLSVGKSLKDAVT